MTCSQLFAVPKPDGSARPILNLSDRRHTDRSVNDDINPFWRTVSYVQQKEIIETLLAVGRGAFMWAKDLVDGFYNVAIRASDVALLGFYFDKQIYLFQVLAMGLGSAPRIFDKFMQFPMWAIRHDKPELYFETVPFSQEIASHFRSNSDISYDPPTKTLSIPLCQNYADDIFGVHRDYDKAKEQWNHAEKVLRAFSLRTNQKKGRGPARIQVLLGFEYNSLRLEVRLGDEKYHKYRRRITDILENGTRYIDAHDLLSIIGQARHMGSIYRPLNAFARGLEKYIYDGRGQLRFKQIHISDAVKQDLFFLRRAMDRCNKYGTPYAYFVRNPKRHDIVCWTDASLTVGVGGYSTANSFFQHKWTDIALTKPEQKDINWREMAAIHSMLFMLYDQLGSDGLVDKNIRVWTDNMSCKWWLQKMSAKIYRPDVQAMINQICDLCIVLRLHLWMDHIPGKDNIVADALSRFFTDPFGTCTIDCKQYDTTAHLERAVKAAEPFNIKTKYLEFEDDDESPSTD